MKLFSFGVLALLWASLVQDKPILTYKTATGIIIVLYKNANADIPTDAKKENRVILSGEPVTITNTGDGSTITGLNVDLTLGKLPKGAVALRAAVVKGKGHVTVDSAIAEATKKENAAKAGKPYVEPTSTEVTQVDSESFSYQVAGSEGKLEFPTRWTCHQDSKGTSTSQDKKSQIAFVNVLDISGSSGVMNLYLKQDGSYDKPKTGHIEGPVKFKCIRTETDLTTKVVTATTYIATCDQVDMDFTTTPGTIVASGHVEIDESGTQEQVHTSCDKFTLQVDKDLHPIHYTASGPPARVKAKDGSH